MLIFAILGYFLHWLNCSTKVSVERWPHCHRCIINILSNGPNNFSNNIFYSTFFIKHIFNAFILVMNFLCLWTKQDTMYICASVCVWCRAQAPNVVFKLATLLKQRLQTSTLTWCLTTPLEWHEACRLYHDLLTPARYHQHITLELVAASHDLSQDLYPPLSTNRCDVLSDMLLFSEALRMKSLDVLTCSSSAWSQSCLILCKGFVLYMNYYYYAWLRIHALVRPSDIWFQGLTAIIHTFCPSDPASYPFPPWRLLYGTFVAVKKLSWRCKWSGARFTKKKFRTNLGKT